MVVGPMAKPGGMVRCVVRRSVCVGHWPLHTTKPVRSALGVGVAVGVVRGVFVGTLDAVPVGVLDGVLDGVRVGVIVPDGVFVGVDVLGGVAVGVPQGGELYLSTRVWGTPFVYVPTAHTSEAESASIAFNVPTAVE